MFIVLSILLFSIDLYEGSLFFFFKYTSKGITSIKPPIIQANPSAKLSPAKLISEYGLLGFNNVGKNNTAKILATNSPTPAKNGKSGFENPCRQLRA